MNVADPMLSASVAADARWAVRFLPLQRGSWSRTPKSRWRMTGKGAVSVGADGIELEGWRHRFLWLPARQRVSLAPSAIRNVVATGRVVSFEADAADGKTERVRLRAADPGAAGKLAQALPQTCTPAFARSRAEQQAFSSALEQLGTRVIATPVLIALNVLVYLAAASHGAGWVVAKPQILIHWGTNFGPNTLGGQWWRLFTSMFVHFGLLHIALNMWALAALGPRIERLFGSACYLLLYVFAGLAGSLATLWWHPWVNSAGASGAIFGVIGGWLAFTLNPATRLPAAITANQRASATVFILYNLVYGFGHQGIDNACHIGGLLGGLAMGWLLAQPLDPEARREQPARLLLAAALGVASLAALAWPLARRAPVILADVAFREDLVAIGTEETQALAATRQLWQELKSHRITDAVWADQITRTVIPTWIDMERRISADSLPATSRLSSLRQALLAYLDDRRQGLQLLSGGVRDGDASEIDRGKAMLRRSDDAARQVRDLIARLQ
jgi:membrane associated rhomboid family serine protease